MSLKNNTLRALGWNTISLVVGFPLKFALNVLLTRLLLPEYFGVIAVPLVLIQLSDMMIDSGFKNSLIQQNRTDSHHYTSVFLFNFALALGFYLIIFLLSFYLDDLIDIPNSGLLARLLGFSFILKSLYLVQEADANIQMNFKKQVLFELCSYAVAYSVAIAFAYTYSNVYALIIFFLMVPFVNLVLYWFNSTWSPKLKEFEWSIVRQHWRFGRNVLGSGLVMTISRKLDVLLLANNLSESILGSYTKGIEYSQLVAISSSKLISRPSFVIFSKIKDNYEKHLSYFLSSLSLISFWISFSVFTLFLFSDVIILHLLGGNWISTIPIFKVLLLSTIFYALSGFIKYIFLSKGWSGINLRINLINSAIRILGLIVIFQLSRNIELSILMWIVWWQVIVQALEFFANQYYVLLKFKVSVLTLFKTFLPTVILALMFVLYLVLEPNIVYSIVLFFTALVIGTVLVYKNEICLMIFLVFKQKISQYIKK